MQRFLSLITVAVLVNIALIGTARASSPSSGTLTDPSSGGTSSVSWTGGPYTGATADPTACTTLTCDTYALTLNIPADFYASNPNDTVTVSISWPDSQNDFDLYVIDSGGNTVCQSATGAPQTGESTDCGQLPAGTYTVQVVAFAVVNESYSGVATLGPQSSAGPFRRAHYKTGGFTFSSNHELPPPQVAGGVLGSQDVEPRAVYDSMGNIYVAAIQGVPAGTDVWRSMDHGSSFQFMGQSDGGQAVNSTTNQDVGGAGGGDEDIAITSNDTIDVNSLWLGSLTSAVSTNQAQTWIANPVSSDVPADDREWIAADGANTIYLTYHQLGDGVNGDSLLVFVSHNGGLTFTPSASVTLPFIGTPQPYIEGNITVDPANHNVYIVFTSDGGTKLWVAKSTDGAQHFTLSNIYTAPNNIANTFPSIAVDRGGNIHVVFCDSKDVYLMSSSDQGTTWTEPVRVNNSAGSKSSMFPWVSGGAPGVADITWYGSSDSNPNDTAATWNVYFAQVTNALARVPRISGTVASDHIVHTGPICNQGLNCASGTRTLADYFTNTIYYNGEDMIVYADDSASPGNAHTYFTMQTGGSTAW